MNCENLFVGYGYKPYFVEGDEPAAMHQLMAATLDPVLDEIHDPDRSAQGRRKGNSRLADDHPESRQRAGPGRRRWTGSRPKGSGVRTRCRFAEMAPGPNTSIARKWMRSYRPEELFDETGGRGRKSPRSRRKASGG